MRLLETLARIDATENSAFAPLIQQQRYHLAWGTTLIVITGQVSDPVLEELYQARRSGQSPMLILAGRDTSDETMERRAKVLGIPFVSIADESDLRIWMQGTKRR
jgi:hypothetical protein